MKKKKEQGLVSGMEDEVDLIICEGGCGSRAADAPGGRVEQQGYFLLLSHALSLSVARLLYLLLFLTHSFPIIPFA